MTRFRLVTDNSALKWLRTSKATPKFMRWLNFLSSFEFEVVHWPGKSNPADVFSRIPLVEKHTKTLLEELEDKTNHYALFSWADAVEALVCEKCDSDEDPD